MRPEDPPRAPSDPALLRSEHRFWAIIEGFADPILGVDGELLVRYANAALTRVLGHRVGDVLARPVGELLHPDERAALEAELARALAAPDAGKLLEHRFHRADGGWEVVETTPNNLLDPVGHPVLVLHVRCVTERRRLQAQLLQQARIETVGRLAAGLAHDFNNLLAAINATAAAALEGPPGRDEREALEVIRQAGERAAALTRQLLALGRAPRGPAAVLDLNRVVHRLVPVLRRLMPGSIAIEARLARELWRVRADEDQLDQVIMNLAMNGRDAMPSGGTLTLETGNAELDPRGAAARYAVLEVADTGTGMDAATRERIFEPFFTTKGPGKGTGLGLATVYDIVKRSGGEIGCSSEPGRGTRFRVYLPEVDGSA